MNKKDIKPNATYGEIQKKDSEQAWKKYRDEKYWEYRKNWEDYPKKMITPDFPLCLDIETTNVCNLDCIMCPRTVLIARNEYSKLGFMHFDVYRKIIDEGEKYNLPSVKLQYLGEPLAHPDIAKQIKYAKDAGIVDVMFNTNATLLTEKKSHEILEAGIDALFFSFDSMDRDTYNKIRLGASYDKVLKNIHRFIEIKNKYGYEKVHTRVSMTVMKPDIESIEQFQKYWLKYVDAAGFGIYNDVVGTLKDSPYVSNFVCAQPFQRMFIMWDGVSTPCCADDNRHYIYGNINKSSIYDVWHGTAAEKMRKMQIEGKYNKISLCKNCYVPHTTIDGQIINEESVIDEINSMADKQKERWIDSDLELSKKAKQRFDRVSGNIS